MVPKGLYVRAGTTADPGEVLIPGPFHTAGCACCGVRSPLAALGRVWRDHAMGKPVAGAVVAMPPKELARAYAADSLAQARFLLVRA
jgi:hypothetical protein